MQHRNHPHSPTKVLGIVSKLLQGLPSSPEQTAIYYFPVAQSIAIKLAWKRKHHMKIGNVQELILACTDPLLALVSLTGRAMSVPATVVTDVQSVTTITFINVAAHSFGATPPYGLQGAVMPGGQAQTF